MWPLPNYFFLLFVLTIRTSVSLSVSQHPSKLYQWLGFTFGIKNWLVHFDCPTHNFLQGENVYNLSLINLSQLTASTFKSFCKKWWCNVSEETQPVWVISWSSVVLWTSDQCGVWTAASRSSTWCSAATTWWHCWQWRYVPGHETPSTSAGLSGISVSPSLL